MFIFQIVLLNVLLSTRSMLSLTGNQPPGASNKSLAAVFRGRALLPVVSSCLCMKVDVVFSPFFFFF